MKKKISLTGLFLLSFLTSVFSIIRICQVEAMLKTGDSTMLVMLGTIEICTGVRTVKIFDSKMSVYH